jgi:predicted CXXCH cytochrome family protein
VAALAVGAAAWLLLQPGQPGAPASPDKGAQVGGVEDEQLVFAQYGGSQSCRECHEEAFALWTNSNHALAERHFDLALDRPAFHPPRSFPHGSQSSSVQEAGGAFQLSTSAQPGETESYALARVIGRDPLRQYLVPFPGGRFQATEAAYDPRSNQWFNVYGSEDRRAGEWGHWTGRGMNWNFMCASCHNTRLRRNYDPATDSYRTTMAELSVGCEACHGPLKLHNEWQKQYGKSGRKDPTLTKLSRAKVIDYCGFCHSRRTDLTGDFKPGDAFGDHCELVIVDRTDRYYADGQVRDEDYEYGSFLGSKMHGRGVYCLDCHDPHSAKTRVPGNWLCLRCHNGSDTNAPNINPVTHSRHKVFGFDTNGQPVNLDLTAYHPATIKETGGECVNCHMPQTPYMQRHWRHDHGFTIPDPLLTVKWGIPNACNRCHQDKDAQWSLKYCEEWYGPKMERPTRKRAQLVARAQRGDPQVREELLAAAKTEESPYWRAVLLGLLEPWSARPEVCRELLKGLEDSEALVRSVAAGSLESALAIPGLGVNEALQRRLEDPVRSVRVAAASVLRATVDPASPAGRDLQHCLDNSADQPGGQLQQAVYHLSRQNPEAALVHIQKAVAWDPYSAPFRQQLAVVLSALNRPREALDALEAACRLAPKDASCHFQLGLARHELGDLPGTEAALKRAVELDPAHARAWYNLGLAQSSSGQEKAALDSLLRAGAADPEAARVPYARATILARSGRVREAREELKRCLEIDPGFREARELLSMLERDR